MARLDCRAKGVTVCGLHVHSELAAGSPLTVNLYQTEGGYAGKEGDATLWRLVASESVLASGAARTFVPLSTPLHLATGVSGICMEHVGASPVYTGIGTTLTVSNADLSITAGTTQAEPVFDPASTLYTPRIANVALHYSTTASTGAAGYGYIGLGCPGSLGVPGNVALSQPVLGGTTTMQFDNLPFDLGVITLGMTRAAPPVDLVIIGMPACMLHHSGEFVTGLAGAGNVATFDLSVPNNTALIGTQIYSQAGSLDIGLNPFGFAISDAAVLLVGQ